MPSRDWVIRAVVVAAAAIPAHGAELLFDDFSGAALDSNKWALGTWQLGRTQLGFTPQVTAGMARLRHDTYNPSRPGNAFRGTEIYSHDSFARGTGLEFEARVRTNAMPAGLVTSFFTYTALPGNPPLADEIDFEFLSKQINASSPTSDPVLMTTWNNYRTDGSNFWDPNVHSSVSTNIAGLNLAEFNTFKIRWLPDRVQWYVNNIPVRTALHAVPDVPAPIRANFWAPGTEWQDAYAATLQPTANAASNVSQFYDVDSIAVRRIFSPVAPTAPHRLVTDTFRNGSIADSDTLSGFWTQRNQGASSVSETGPGSNNLAEPLKLTAAGAGYPHAQIASSVRGELNFFRNPIAIEAAGLGVSSTSHSTSVNTIGRSILRFALTSQGLSSGSQSEYTVPDALALRIEGGNVVTLGSKVNAPNQNTEFTANLLHHALSGPVRRVRLVMHGTFYDLQVEHDLSASDSSQVMSEFSGPLSLDVADWNASGESSLILQAQLNNAAAGENMTALVDSLAVTAVRPAWNVDGDGSWGELDNWTDRPVPDYPGANARFTSAISAPRTITTDRPVKAGKLTFDSSAAYTIAGVHAITLDTLIDEPRIEVLNGAHTISAPLTLSKNTTIDTAAGSSILLGGDVNAIGITLTKTGPGTVELPAIRSAGMIVSEGALRMFGREGSADASYVDMLSIAPGALLDLRDNDMVVDGEAIGTWEVGGYTGITGLIQRGRNGGSWDGSGIITSGAVLGSLMSLGIASAGDIGAAGDVWGGHTVDGSDVLVRYTYSGDANLDGVVNIDDYGRIDSNVRSSGSVFGWFNGDFNYDGQINIDDYGVIDSAIAASGNSPVWGGAADAAAVPEPGLVGAVLVALLLPRRRRGTPPREEA